jgi:hypothetical protein
MVERRERLFKVLTLREHERAGESLRPEGDR